MRSSKFYDYGSIITSPQGRQIIIRKLLGAGSYGQVYQVGFQGQTYALKRQFQMTSSEQDTLKVLSKRTFQNLVNIIDFFEIDSVYFILMENCEENLYDRICKSLITHDEFRYMMQQIANGIKELHNLNIIHRDIKPENILLFNLKDHRSGLSQITYKICDFGTANWKNTAKTLIGTPYYMAPEQLLDQQYNEKVDIWAFACVMYECLKGNPLFSGKTGTEIFEKISKLNPAKEIQALPIFDEYKQVLQKMLDKDPKRRPNIEEILQGLKPRITRSVTRQPPPQQKIVIIKGNSLQRDNIKVINSQKNEGKQSPKTLTIKQIKIQQCIPIFKSNKIS